MARWYVRGTSESHRFDLQVRLAGRPGEAFCQTCLMVHARPLGRDWHVEGHSVDYMLCGVKIDLETSDVRSRRPKNVCSRCLAKAEEEAA